MAEVEVHLDNRKVAEAIASARGTKAAIGSVCSSISASANMQSAGFRTGRFYDRAERKLKGDTQPRYAYDVERRGGTIVGLVYTANYSAMKDNHLHNTLLKSVRS